MVYRWSEVQTTVGLVELQNCLKWIGLLVSSGYLYRSDYSSAKKEKCLILQVFYSNKQLHIREQSPWIINTRELIMLMRLSRTGTRIMKRLFFPFYQKWFNFLHWGENWKEWRKKSYVTAWGISAQLTNCDWSQNISVLLNITAYV